MSLFQTIWDLDQDQQLKQIVEKLEWQEKVIEELSKRVLLLEQINNKHE